MRRSSCLVSALVLQRWDAEHGLMREVVIGVTQPEEFGAHAWLEGETHGDEGEYIEIRRLAAPGANA
jgi:hypothetical protein